MSPRSLTLIGKVFTMTKSDKQNEQKAMERAPDIIKPTVGRVVLFHPNDAVLSARFFSNRLAPLQPHSAQVAYVWDDRLVNLAVIDHNGKPCEGFTNVVLRQPHDNPPAPGTPYCEWMPFQVGQALKALEPIKKDRGF